MLELKPCPFCGGEAELVGPSFLAQAVCTECGARTRFESCNDYAVAAWNKRHTTVAASGKVSEELMKRILDELSKDGGKEE